MVGRLQEDSKCSSKIRDIPLRHSRKFCKDLANQPVCMRIDEYARRYTATISGVIQKTNCGRRFTLLDLLVAGILQRGQPDERKVCAYNTAYMCLLLHNEYDMLTVWEGGECVIQRRSNLTPDEDDPSWLEAYRFTVW